MLLQIDKDRAIKVYNSVGVEIKKLMEALFPDVFTTTKSGTDINSLEDALQSLGKTLEEILPYAFDATDNTRKLHNNIAKRIAIADAINGNWRADFNNPNQKKWYAWYQWDTNESAFVFSNTGCNYGFTCTYVGVHLYFENSKNAEHFGKIAEALFNQAVAF